MCIRDRIRGDGEGGAHPDERHAAAEHRFGGLAEGDAAGEHQRDRAGTCQIPRQVEEVCLAGPGARVGAYVGTYVGAGIATGVAAGTATGAPTGVRTAVSTAVPPGVPIAVPTGIGGAAGHRRALVTAPGQLDQVDAEGREHLDHPPRVVGVEPAALEVGGVQLHRDREGR